jgi:hypothetical protein
MTIAAVTQDQVSYPWDADRSADLKKTINDLVTAVNAGAQVVNSLSADTAGRAMMATGYFNEATVDSKFAAGAIDSDRIKSASILPTQLATVVMGAPTTRSGAGAIAITAPTCLLTTTGTGDALTVADGTYAGQRLTVKCVGDGGTGVITQTTGAKLRAAVTTITFTNVGDWVVLEWSGTLWNDVAQSGVMIA